MLPVENQILEGIEYFKHLENQAITEGRTLEQKCLT